MARTRQQAAANANKQPPKLKAAARVPPTNNADVQGNSQATSVVDLPSQEHLELHEHEEHSAADVHAFNGKTSFFRNLLDDSEMLDATDMPDDVADNEITISQAPAHANRRQLMPPPFAPDSIQRKPRSDGASNTVNTTFHGLGGIFPEEVEAFDASTEQDVLINRLEQLRKVLATAIADFGGPGAARGGETEQERAAYRSLAVFLATESFVTHDDKHVRLLVADALAALFHIVTSKLHPNGPLNREQYNNFMSVVLGATIPAFLEDAVNSDNFQIAVGSIKNIRESEAFGVMSLPAGLFSRPQQKSQQQLMMNKVYDGIVKVVYNIEKLREKETDAAARLEVHENWRAVSGDLARLVGDALFGGKHATFPPERLVLAILHEYTFNISKADSEVAFFMESILQDVDRVEPAVCQVVCTELTKYSMQGYMSREKFAWQSTMSLFSVSPLYVKNLLPTIDAVMRVGTEERRVLYVIALGSMWAQASFYAGNLLRQADRQFIELNFLARGHDMHPKVRQQMVACLPGILFEHGSGNDSEQVIDKVRAALRSRLLDPDDTVREATLETVGAIIKEAMLTTGIVNKMPIFFRLFDKELVQDTYGRVRDISGKVRQAALYAATECYVRYLRALQRGDVARAHVVERFSAFPEFILETFSTCHQGADKILIERLLFISLFSLGGRDATTGKSQAVDSSDERARRFVCLYCSLVDNAWDVFHLLLAYHFRTHEYAQQLLRQVHALQVKQKRSASGNAAMEVLNPDQPVLPQTQKLDASSNEFQRIRMRLEQYHLTDPQRNMNEGYQQLIELIANNKDAYRYAVQLVSYDFGDDPRPLLKKFRDLCGRVEDGGLHVSTMSTKKLDASHKSVVALAGDRVADRIVPFLFSSGVLRLVIKYAVMIAREPERLPELFIPASGHSSGRLSSEDVQKRALDLVRDVLILYPSGLSHEPAALSDLMRIPEEEENADLATSAIKVLIKWCKPLQREVDAEVKAHLVEINPRLLSLMRRLVRGSSKNTDRRDSLALTTYSPYVAKEAIRFIEQVSERPLDEFKAILDHLRPRLEKSGDVQCASAVAVIGDMANLVESCDVDAAADETAGEQGGAAERKREQLRAQLSEIFRRIVEPKLIQAELNRSSMSYRTFKKEQERPQSNMNYWRNNSADSLRGKAKAVNIDNVNSPNDAEDADGDIDAILDLSEVELDQVASQMRASQGLRGLQQQKMQQERGVDADLPSLDDEQEDEVDEQNQTDQQQSAAMQPSQSTTSRQVITNISVLNSNGDSNVNAFRPKTVLPVRVQTKLYAMRAYGKWASSLTLKRDSVFIHEEVLPLFYNVIRVHSKPGTTSTQSTAGAATLPKHVLSELDRCYTVYTASVVLLRLFRRFNPSFGVKQLQCLSSLMQHTACSYNELRLKFCYKLKRLSREQMPVWVLLIFAHGVKLPQDANDDALRDAVATVMDSATTQFRQLVMESPGKMARYLPELIIFYAIYYMAHSKDLVTISRPGDDRMDEDFEDAGGVRHWTGEEPVLQNFVRMLNFIIETISRAHPQFTLNAVTFIIQRIKTCHIIVDSLLLQNSPGGSNAMRHAEISIVNEQAETDRAHQKLRRSITERAWALADLCNDVLTARFVHRVPGPLLNVDVIEPKSLFEFDSGLNVNKTKRTVKNIQVYCRMRAKPYTDVVQIGRPSALATQSSTQFDTHPSTQSSTATTIGGDIHVLHRHHGREPQTPAAGGKRQAPPARRAFTTPKRVSVRRRADEENDEGAGLDEIDVEEEFEDEIDAQRDVTDFDDEDFDEDALWGKKAVPRATRAIAGAFVSPADHISKPKAKTAKAAFRYLQPPSLTGRKRQAENADEEDAQESRVLRSSKKSAQVAVVAAEAVTPQVNKRARRNDSNEKRRSWALSALMNEDEGAGEDDVADASTLSSQI